MTATILNKRPVIGMCVLAACAALLAQPAVAKKAASDSGFNAAMVAGDPMSPINPFNGGADPLTMPGDARIGVFPYSRDQIYRVLTAPLKLTTIELEKGEKLIADPAMGDSVQWEIDDDKMNHVFIKPHKADLVNTLHLTTNLREYDFTLIASPAGGMFYQTVRFQYPRAPMARVSARDDATANGGRGGADSGSISVAPDKLNWDYSVDGRAEFTPEDCLRRWPCGLDAHACQSAGVAGAVHSRSRRSRRRELHSPRRLPRPSASRRRDRSAFRQGRGHGDARPPPLVRGVLIVAKKPDSATPSAEQEALVKGKTPRNAIMSIGILAAVVIGGLGFYYQLQATNKADEEARIKKATALKSSTEAPTQRARPENVDLLRLQTLGLLESGHGRRDPASVWRGSGSRVYKLYRFPVMFAFDDWLRNVPNQMAAYTTAGRQYFSEYDRDGKRYCKTYAPVERDARAQRARRSFGGDWSFTGKTTTFPMASAILTSVRSIRTASAT